MRSPRRRYALIGRKRCPTERNDASPITATTVAVLSDAHGNATALEAVLAEVDREQPDVVVFGGDLT